MQDGTHICTACGCVAAPERVTKGSFIVELFLWLMFLAPGLIYSIWRLASRFDACPMCKSPQMIPVASPRGQMLLAQVQGQMNAAR